MLRTLRRGTAEDKGRKEEITPKGQLIAFETVSTKITNNNITLRILKT